MVVQLIFITLGFRVFYNFPESLAVHQLSLCFVLFISRHRTCRFSERRSKRSLVDRFFEQTAIDHATTTNRILTNANRALQLKHMAAGRATAKKFLGKGYKAALSEIKQEIDRY
jgi:hypothetical protein